MLRALHLASPHSPFPELIPLYPCAFLACSQEAAFLPLDDILEGKHIDIDIDGGGHSSGRARNRRRSSVAPNNSFHGGRGNGHGKDGGGGGLSVGGDVPDITRPPMFLMEQDYGNSFKMSTCAPQQQVSHRCAQSGWMQELVCSCCSMETPEQRTIAPRRLRLKNFMAF